ncbi:MAG: HAD family hydrolase [Chthoniobacterales bacterium]
MKMAPPNDRSPAVFLDRDGTIMRDVGYCGDPAHVEIFAGTSAALQRLRDSGFRTFVITNQSGIGRGYFSEADYLAVAAEVDRRLGVGLINGTYFCPDVPGSDSHRRKPAPAMILEAQCEHAIDLERSFMVGDKPIDVECGRNAGVQTILVRTGKPIPGGDHGADWEAEDLAAAVEIILRHAR